MVHTWLRLIIPAGKSNDFFSNILEEVEYLRYSPTVPDAKKYTNDINH